MAKPTRTRESWQDAIMKVESEGACRVCSLDGEETNGRVEAAHTIGRKAQDVLCTGPRGGEYVYVSPDSIVPLCSYHHRLFDARGLDLLPYLDLDEQEASIRPAGGIEGARKRLVPSDYRKGAA